MQHPPLARTFTSQGPTNPILMPHNIGNSPIAATQTIQSELEKQSTSPTGPDLASIQGTPATTSSSRSEADQVPPLTPSQDIVEAATVEAARNRSYTTSNESFTSKRLSRVWSPSLSGASRPSSSSTTLSRQASISSASSHLTESGSPQMRNSKVLMTPHILNGTENDAQPLSPTPPSSMTPRRARSVNRKRMSLGYISSPASAPATHPSSSSYYCLSPTPSSLSSSSTSRGDSHQYYSNQSVAAFDAFGIHTAPASQLAFTTDDRQQHSLSSSSQSVSDAPPREDGQTVMDSSKDLLAEIASRERRVGELRSELKREEVALKDLQTKWQTAVTKEMNSVRSPDLSKLRAPRQVNGARAALARVNSASNAKAPPVFGGTEGEQEPVNGQLIQADMAATMADAIRGLSAKLPAGLSSQFNSLIDGLNVPGAATATSPGEWPGSSSGRGLDVLKEESSELGSDPGDIPSKGLASSTRAGANADNLIGTSTSSSTATFSGSPPTFQATPNVHSSGSNRASTLFGSLSAIRGQLGESLKAGHLSNDSADSSRTNAQSSGKILSTRTLGVDGPPVSSLRDMTQHPTSQPQLQPPSASWLQWSKSIKDAASDAAARVDKAFGEAIGVGDASSMLSSSTGVVVDGRSTGSIPISTGTRGNLGAPKMSSSPSKERRSFSDENEREKAALAELELGWLSNLVGGGSGSNEVSGSAVTGQDAVDSQPRRLSDRTLLALSAGDGIAPEPDVVLSPRQLSTTNSGRKEASQRSPASGTTKTTGSNTTTSGGNGGSASASARHSMLPGSSLFGMLSQAWGADKIGSGTDGHNEDALPPPSTPSPGCAKVVPDAATTRSTSPPELVVPAGAASSEASSSLPSPTSSRMSLQDRLKDKAAMRQPQPHSQPLLEQEEQQQAA